MQKDAVLIKAWRLALEDYTEENAAKIEELLPTLVEAGYVEEDEHTWNFTAKGVERADTLLTENRIGPQNPKRN